MSKKHSFSQSISFALEGIIFALRNDPNFKIQAIVAVFALILAIMLEIPFAEAAILVLTIGLVLILELINTTLEALVDLATEEIKPRAKAAKDVSAAAVLLSAILSIIVGCLLFIPKIIRWITLL